MYEKAKKVVQQVAKECMVSVSDILSERRRQWQVVARQEAMRRLRDELHLSYPEIAMILKRRDHTTVMHGVKRARERRKDPKYFDLDK